MCVTTGSLKKCVSMDNEVVGGPLNMKAEWSEVHRTSVHHTTDKHCSNEAERAMHYRIAQMCVALMD